MMKMFRCHSTEKISKANRKSVLFKFGPLLALVLLSAVLSFSSEYFLALGNLMNILRQASIICLIASGMLVVIITAGIDLSVGPVTALSICVMGVLMKKGLTHPLALIAAGLCTGLLCGMANGFLLTKLKLPHPFISTLGMRNVARGLALIITGAAPISGFPASVQFLGAGFIGGVFPVSFLVVLILSFVFHIFLNKTALGRHIYAVGGNREAARLSGIKVDKILLFVYSLSGFMAAFGGLLLVGRVNAAFPLAGEKFDLDAIAAVIIGGASFFGGKGSIWGTLVGALIITVLRNGLNLLSVSADAQLVAIGLVIILAVYIDVLRSQAEMRTKRSAPKP